MPQVTVLGGGQLGRMLAWAGVPLGVSVRFLDPNADAPAGALGSVVVGPLDDLSAAHRAAEGAAVVTYEWEGVPATTVRALAASGYVVHPGPGVLEMAQDRLAEKQRCRALGIPTTDFAAVDCAADLDCAVAQLGLPIVLKTRRGGYDGKGQRVFASAADGARARGELGGVPMIAEAFVDFDRELSILAARGADGKIRCWPVVENDHRDGILRVTRAPAPRLDVALQTRAEACIVPLLDAYDYIGVCCVELFDTNGTLLVNEIAPRVHNSGHWTIEGARTSQFENHLRAVLGWPIGETAALGSSAMLNCIGTLPAAEAVSTVAGAHFHDYGKAARPGRKLGHITVTAPDDATLQTRVDAASRFLKDGA
ncbi:MAG: 5-(carboxyamino)imidazole ribonucleotide synthase [Actinomycetota bacterium]